MSSSNLSLEVGIDWGGGDRWGWVGVDRIGFINFTISFVKIGRGLGSLLID